MADISGEVRRVVCRCLDVAESRVKPEASFIDDLGADSLALVVLTLVLEETLRSPTRKRRRFGPFETR
jgi:acyl carrier protein